MNRISHIFRVSFALLAVGLVARSMVSEAHGIASKDSVVITATQSVPARLVGPGEKKFHDAAGAIAVVGEGKRFTVQEGGKAILTSGRSIRLLPGTKVRPGGELIVKVTSERKARNVRNKSTLKVTEKQFPKLPVESVEIATAYRYFPMSEPETITLAMNGTRGVLPARVRVSNGADPLVKEKKASFQYFPGPVPSVMQGSLQTLRLRWGEQQGNIRILRT